MEQLDVLQPRAFGYYIGDKFERSIELKLRKPYQLELSKLPKAGKLTNWLVVEAPHVEKKYLANSTQYHIRLTYQITNIDPELKDIGVPQHFLFYSDGNETSKILVQATRIKLSVLRDNTQDALQPDTRPSVLPLNSPNIILYGALFVGSFAGLAFLYWGLPFGNKRQPFTEAYRSLRRLRHRTWDDESYLEALQIIHLGFNATAGKTVFAEQLDEFFDENNQFAPVHQRIRSYYAHSREVFFESHTNDPSSSYSLPDLIGLVQTCRDIERGLA